MLELLAEKEKGPRSKPISSETVKVSETVLVPEAVMVEEMVVLKRSQKRQQKSAFEYGVGNCERIVFLILRYSPLLAVTTGIQGRREWMKNEDEVRDEGVLGRHACQRFLKWQLT